MKKTNLLAALATATLGAGTLLGTGCNKQSAAQTAAPFAVPVTVVSPLVEDVPVFIDEIGKTTASEVVTVQPQVSGMIMERHFDDGAEIKQGQLLFVIDTRPFKAILDQATGQLAKDTAAVKNFEWSVNQDNEALQTKGAISLQQLHTDTSSLEQSKASMLVDKATIDSANLNLQYCQIKSPISGRAGARLVDVGNVVTAAGQAPGTNLLSIQNVDPIYADFTIDEGQLGSVRRYMAAGQLQTQVSLPEETVQITAMTAAGPATHPATAPATMPTTHPADAAGPRLGKLIFLDNSVQDGGGTIKLRAELPNSDLHFWPGQFVNVRLVLKMQKGAVLIPRQSTQLSQTGPFVYTVDEKSTCQMRPVKLGQLLGDMVVVDSGISSDDKIVMTGQQLLQPGGQVMVQPSTPAQGGQK